MNIGTLLVATPSVMGDVNFNRAVVLLVNQNDSGSIGFILNKKLEYSLDEVMDGITSKQPLYFGGPVEPDNLFYIHTLGNQISKSILISDSLYWNGDFEEVTQLMETGILNEENIRFFLGYSGWLDSISNQFRQPGIASPKPSGSWLCLSCDRVVSGRFWYIRDTGDARNQHGSKY